MKRTKVCSKCKEEKSLSKFSKNKRMVDRHAHYCCKCKSMSDKKHCIKLTKKNKKFYQSNGFKKATKVCSICKEEKVLIEYSKKANTTLGVNCACKKCMVAKKHADYEGNKDSYKRRARKRYDLHTEEIKAYSKEHRIKNWDKILEQKRTRYRTIPGVKIARLLRGRFIDILKRIKVSKNESVFRLVACSLEDVESHLKGLFTKRMTWEKVLNGKIHIDHIVPCSAFDLRNSEEREICFHYTNLQPLWAKDNLSKSNRYIGDAETQLYIDLAIIGGINKCQYIELT